MKKAYINPTMNVHTIKVHHHILDASPSAPSVNNTGTDIGEGGNLGKDDWEDDEYSW